MKPKDELVDKIAAEFLALVFYEFTRKDIELSVSNKQAVASFIVKHLLHVPDMSLCIQAAIKNLYDK